MKLTTLILITAILQVSANSFAQKISLSEKNASLNKVFDQIRTQTGYDFFFTTSILQQAKPVTINVKNEEMEAVLKKIFEDQDLEYAINKKSVMVTRKMPSFLDRTVSVIQSTARDLFSAIDISGLVLDEKGLPFAGVTVKVKGTNKATSTGNDGKFYLAGVDDDAVIEIRMVGYKVLERSAKGNFDELRLEVLSKELEEVVVAYGKTTQQALTGAVTVVKGEQIQNLPSRSFDKSLQGLVPGLQITGGTGQPGGGVANMVLRGISTGANVASGETTRNPLIVIDGIPVTQDNFQFQPVQNATPVTNPLAQLNPSDIESITVLKDASAIALYGSQASNGVILVTTKRGKAGKTVFNFRQQTDVSTRLKGEIEVLNSEEYLTLLYETYRNTPRVVGGVSTPWTDADILTDLKTKFPVKGDGSFYQSPDWYSELFTRRAITTSTEAGMSGGSEKSNFYLNAEYTKQNGAVQGTGYDRKSMRFNFESRPASWLNLGTNTALSYNIQNYSNDSESPSRFATGYTLSPLNPSRLEDGSYKLVYPFGATSSATLNPVADIEYNVNKNVIYRGLSKFYAEVKLFEFLSFKSDLGVDFMLSEAKQKTDPRFFASSSSAARPRIFERDDRRANFINNNILRFNKSFAKHSVNLLLGQEAQIISSRLLQAESEGTAATLPYYDQLTSSSYTMKSIRGITNRQTLLSVFGQANYGYLSRYFLSASIRKDGSSKFGDQSQWGTYWSTGAGWVLSEEKLMKQYVPWIDYLKLRGSIGAAGNSGAVNPLTRFDQLFDAKFLGMDAFSPSQNPGNPEIQWEETFTWDAGLEIRLLKDRLSLTVDIYHKKTKNLIYSTNLPSITGFDAVQDNIGDMENSGIEFSFAGTVIQNKRFRWNLNANWSSNQNKLIKANVPLASVSGGLLSNEEGRNFNSFYMPVWFGVNPADGKPQWKDANGLPTSTYNNAKKEFVGKPQPDGFGAVTNAFSYSAFTLSAQLYYQYGLKIYNSTFASPLLSDGRFSYNNQVKQALNYWKKPGDIAANPRRLLSNTPDGGTNPSTRYLSSGDYIRLQNVTLSYAFSKSLLSRLRLSALKIYLQGHNIAMFTLFPGPDPDNASVGGNTAFAYPNQRSFSAGLNVNF